MKKALISVIIILCICTAMMLTACTEDNVNTDTSPKLPSESQSATESETTTNNESDTPAQTESDTPAQTESNTPVQTESDTPVQTESDTPVQTESDTPVQTESDTPAQTESDTPVQTESDTPAQTESDTPVQTESDTPVQTESDTQTEVETEPIVNIEFNGNSASISHPDRVSVNGKKYTITAAGTYRITGTMNDGQIRVNVQKTEKVTLLLDNFTGNCSYSAVIYVMSADKVDIDLEKNSVNRLTDAQTYVFENPLDDKPNACIYSSDDLTIKGGGTLYVTARYNNGIGCKNDIDIKNGVVEVSAVKNAIKGNDSVTVRGDAVVNVTSAKDALKADTTDRADKGFVLITETAQVNVTCSDEAIQATQSITITAGATLKIVEAKNPYKCDGTVSIDEGCII